MKRTVLLIACASLVLYSACQNPPKPVTGPETPTTGTTSSSTGSDTGDDNAVVAKFENVTITKQAFKQTKTEIELVVVDLNKITYEKDYTRWLTYLSDEYKSTFSDPAGLEKVSKSLPTKGIKLKNLKDYFTYVFVPSRQNMRVDDIQFVSPTRVYVIMELMKDSPAAIYILENMGGKWKLVPKNQ